MANQTPEQIAKHQEKTLLKLTELYFHLRRDPGLEIPVTEDIRKIFVHGVPSHYTSMQYIPYSYDRADLVRYSRAMENMFTDTNLTSIRGSMPVSASRNLIYAVGFIISQLIYLDSHLHHKALNVE